MSDIFNPSLPPLTGTFPTVPVTLPSGFNWDTANFPMNFLLDAPNYEIDRPNAALGTGAFNVMLHPDYIACLNGAVFYCSTSGSDSTGDGSQLNPVRSIWQATNLLNATGQAGRVIVVASPTNYAAYHRSVNFSLSSSSNFPTVPCMYIASGGRVYVGSMDSGNTWVADMTYPYCYRTSSTAEPASCLNMSEKNAFNCFSSLQEVSSAVQCASTPGSWWYDSGNSQILLNRGDMIISPATTPVANKDTMVLQNTPVFNQRGTVQLSVFFIGALGEPDSGFDFMGGGSSALYAPLQIQLAGAPPATGKIVYAKGCSFRYGGRSTGITASNGVSIESFGGLAFFEQCDASNNSADGFNFHDASGNGVYGLTLNCTGYNNGSQGQNSCNGWTAHDTTHVIDVGGNYEYNNGCQCHIVNNCQGFIVGTRSAHSNGDIGRTGGTFWPTEFRTDDSAKMWCFAPRPVPSAVSSISYSANGTSIMLLRNQLPNLGQNFVASTATLTTY